MSAFCALALVMSGCSSEPSDDDIDRAYENAQDQLSGTTFEEVGDPSDCTEDCSGHDAGFEWARDQGITDESECDGQSQSFIEGCEAYASAAEEDAGEELEQGNE
jgi:hypothetical protein